MLTEVIKSKALYNRSLFELPLQPLVIADIKKFFGENTERDYFEAQLAVGGIPEYLKYLRFESSTYLGLCRHSFLPGAFFLSEYEKIFTSSLAKNPHYRKIIEFLAHQKFSTRDEILKKINIKSGGEITKLLLDLEVSGFVQRYRPLNLKASSRLIRYRIADPYLHFYFRFIQPIEDQIRNGDFQDSPNRALNYQSYKQWLGYGYEQYCRKNSRMIAHCLGFGGVQYQVGSYFSKSSEAEEKGFQIDLIFDRADKTLTVCEMKYQDASISKKIIQEVEYKINLLKNKYPKMARRNIQRVLITNAPVDESLRSSGYFDSIIGNQIFEKELG